MNEQLQMMNDQLQMMNKQPPMMPMNTVPTQQMMNPPQMVPQSQPMMNLPPLMMNRSYNNKPWPIQDLGLNLNFGSSMPNYRVPSNRAGNWKGKKMVSKDGRKFEKPMGGGPAAAAAPGGNQGYKPPSLNELQTQNRLKARKYYKKKFNNTNGRFAPYAPRNTTSYLIRAKKEGGIASLVSPCPVTPAVLPTPMFSPSREVLGDTAKEEWGVDGYGSMKGLIRLRSPGNEPDNVHDDEGADEDEGSSGSDVEEHVEMERRLDHDVSRFEMIYPSHGGGEYNNILESRVDDQDTHIAQLEEENLTLKERLFLMERDLGDLRRRLQFLERHSKLLDNANEEVVENSSENESEGEYGNEVKMETVPGDEGQGGKNTLEVGLHMEMEDTLKESLPESKALLEVCMEEVVSERAVKMEIESKTEGNDEDSKGKNEPLCGQFVNEGIAGENKEDDRKTEGVLKPTETGSEDQLLKCEEARDEGEDKAVARE